MRLLLCCAILINIGRNAMLCYVCHVYSQDLDVFLTPGSNIIPRSVILVGSVINATNCSFCFGILHFNVFISGCRRNGRQESKTLNEFFGIICDVYRQQWIGNSRSKRLNRSSYPTSEQLYRRTDCSACVSLVDEGGVEMNCAEDLGKVCYSMDLLVGGSVVCSGNGDCCCQGENCSEALRNFYSGYQKVLGTPQMFATLSSGHCRCSNSLIIVICLSITVLLGQWISFSNFLTAFFIERKKSAARISLYISVINF
ncbi:unnamed protein product [Wuchereria bancrofti]|uniref:Uncharacterized protein n=1 Tax=Wuchereria bancrofti TaxID=6293 RepID=A0A3P7GA90_WUCBA|nr:unnamed protein product [Wuchereria bancrofti]